MKNRIFLKTMIGAALLLAATSLRAQRILTAEHIRMENVKLVKEADGQLAVSLQVALEAGLDMDANRMITLTPLLFSADSLQNRALAPAVVYGRKRHIVQQRQGLVPADAQTILRREDGRRQTLTWAATVPFEQWMEGGYMALHADLCGCGNAQQEEDTYTVAWMPEKPFPTDEHIAYQMPIAPPVKAMHLEGSAYLDFPVNRTEIYPDYRRNPQELAKIRASIDSVRTDRNATITRITIKGYASPEGSYSNNVRLASGRAQTLRDYVVVQYALQGIPFEVDSEPEDWEGLRRAVQQGSYPQREEALAIIDSKEIKDPDARDRALKRLAVYPTLLNEVYPALRHSDYTVYYTVRDFTVDEAKEIFRTRPWQLSQAEMYRVAKTYRIGSDEYVKLFLTAVQMFPDDETANLNAAAIALRAHDLPLAERYLERAGTSPQAVCNRGLLQYMQGNHALALQLLQQAQAAGCPEADLAAKELERRMKKKEK